jgi:hypothetical protein
MSGDDTHPLAAAWQRVGDAVDETAAEYRDAGYRVVSARADHGTVRDGDPPALVFTVGDDAAARLDRLAGDRQFSETDVQYVDVDGHRLFLSTVVDATDSLAVVLAGGVSHDRLRRCRPDGDEVTDGDRETDSEREGSLGPLDTVVRRADGSHALGLRHESRAPFLSGFPPESR